MPIVVKLLVNHVLVDHLATNTFTIVVVCALFFSPPFYLLANFVIFQEGKHSQKRGRPVREMPQLNLHDLFL